MKWNDELKTSLQCAFLLFCVTCALILLKSARDALYLSAFSTRSLPYLMAVKTTTTVIVAAGYLHLYKSITLKSAVSASFLIYFAGTLFFYFWSSNHLRDATLPLYIWSGIFGTLAPVQAWSVVSSRLLVRQARRSLGFIGSGAIIGGIAGGLLAQLIAEFWTVQALLPIASLFIFLALLGSYFLSGRSELAPESVSADERTFVRKRFILLLMIVVGALTIISTFADFQFKVISQSRIESAEALAVFFGAFYANLGLLTLIFQLLVTPVLMKRIGLSLILSILPAALFAGNGLLLVAPFLWAAIFLKGSDQLLRFSLDRSSMEVIYLAVPEGQRVRIKALVDTVGVRLFEGVGSGLLILLFTLAHFPLSTIAVLSLVFCSVAFGAILLLGDEYAARLKSSVGKKEIQASSFESGAFSASFHNLLPEILKGSTKEMILDLLELLEKDQKVSHYLKALIEHPDAEVRLRTLQVLSGRKEDFSQKVEPLLQDADSGVRLEAVHYLLAHSPMGYLEQIAKLIEDPNSAVRIAANAAVLNHENQDIRRSAYDNLKLLPEKETARSPLEARLEMANVLGFIRHSPFSEELYKRLLADSSQEVQRAVLQSIRRSTPPGLIAALIDVSPDSPVLAETRETLASYGETLLPQLRKMMEDKKRSRDQKKLIIKIADTVGGREASEMLSDAAHGADLPLRFAAIKGMNRLKERRVLEVSEQALESLLEQEMEALKIELQRSQSILAIPGSLISRVLRQRQEWTRERIFRVLGLLYDSKTIYHAYLAFTSRDRPRHESSLELLDALLRSEHRLDILSLMETPEDFVRSEVSPELRRYVLIGYLGARDELPAAALIADLKDNEVLRWKDEITETLRAFPGLSLVEETLEWRHSRLEDSPDLEKKSKSLTALRKMESLGKIDIFARMGPHELLSLAKGSTEVTFQPDDLIFSEGEEPLHIYMLIRGKIERFRSVGRIDEILPGESFGALAALSRQRHLYSARAVESSYCLKLDQDILLEVLEDFPALSHGVFESLAQRIQGLISRVQQLEAKISRFQGGTSR